MAEQPFNEQNTDTVIWAGLEADDTGQPYHLPPRRGPITAVQIQGVSGHSVSIQGTIDGTNWHTLLDRLGATATRTGNGIIELTTAVAAIRPSVTGGSGAVVVTMRSQS